MTTTDQVMAAFWDATSQIRGPGGGILGYPGPQPPRQFARLVAHYLNGGKPMKPSVGRIVLVPFGGQGEILAPAIVTKVYPDAVVDCVAFMARPVPAALPVLELWPAPDQVEDVPGKKSGWIWPPRI